MYFYITVIAINMFMMLGWYYLFRVNRTFIRGIYYTPSTNTMDMEVYTVLGKKIVKGIPQTAIKETETLLKNNKVDRRYQIVQSNDGKSNPLSGYTYFGVPAPHTWQGRQIFDAWLNHK